MNRQSGAVAGHIELALPMKVNQLLPHRGRMCFLSELLGYDEDTAMTRASVRGNIFGLADGTLDPVALVEYAAQLCAAAAGYKILLMGEAPKVGLLVGVRSFTFHRPVSEDDVLTIRMKRKGEVPPIHHTSCKILSGDKEVASGTLKLWQFDPHELPEQPAAAGDPAWSPIHEKGDTGSGSVMSAAISSALRSPEAAPDGLSISKEIVFDEAFVGFQGHFPGYPIVPGVALLSTMAAVAEDCVGKRLRITRIERAKFGKVAFPNHRLSVRVSLEHGIETDGAGDTPEECYRVTGTVDQDGTEYARCRFAAVAG